LSSKAWLLFSKSTPTSVAVGVISSPTTEFEATNPGVVKLNEHRYIAEPKLDGQRAQVHIRNGRTVACYSRPGRDVLRHAGYGVAP